MAIKSKSSKSTNRLTNKPTWRKLRTRLVGQGFRKTSGEIEEDIDIKPASPKPPRPAGKASSSKPTAGAKPANGAKPTGSVAIRKIIAPNSADSTSPPSPPKRPGRPLKLLTQRHANVTEMVAATLDPEFAERFKKSQAARKLVDGLTVLRLIENATQAEMARRTGWAQPKVSRFEGATDADVSLGEVASYCKALGYSIRITVGPEVEATGDGEDRGKSGSSASLASIQVLRRDGKPLEGF